MQFNFFLFLSTLHKLTFIIVRFDRIPKAQLTISISLEKINFDINLIEIDFNRVGETTRK